MNRRHLLAGAAALPLAGVALPAAAGSDPALDAARRYLAALHAEQSYTNPCGDWDDDPAAVALSDETDRWWAVCLATPPTTPEALALLLAGLLYRTEGLNRGAHFSDPESWYDGGTVSQGTLYALLPVLWESPAAAALFPRTTPPCDPDEIRAKVDAEREARLASTA